MENIFGTWNWYIAGPLIGLFVPLLLLVGNKLFGISSSFEHLCTIVLPEAKAKILSYNRLKNDWKFYFILGITLGGLISSIFLSKETIHLLPPDYYTLTGYIKLFVGGLLVGFGTRYANGCTSGHAITGISLLNMASIKSTLMFFAGGLIYTWISYLLFS